MKKKMIISVMFFLAVLLAFTAIPLGVLAATPAHSEEVISGVTGDQSQLADDTKIVDTRVASTPACTYQTHVENIGWQDWKTDGTMSGTEGRSYRLEG